MPRYCLTRRQLFDVWREKDGALKEVKSRHVRDTVMKTFKIEDEHQKAEATSNLSRVCHTFHSKWIRSGRNYVNFERQNSIQWFQTEISVISQLKKPMKRGAPQKPFVSLSDRHRRRKVKPLLQASAPELSYAAQMKARQEGNEDAAKLLKKIAIASPSRPKKVREALKSEEKSKSVEQYTDDEGLSILIETDLSQKQYKHLRLLGKHKNSPNLYPPYERVLEAKQRCYPAKESILVTETEVDIKLQALLDCTAKRLICLQETVIDASFGQVEVVNLVLTSKWGSDGSSSQSNYKQKFSEVGSDDSSIYMTSLVPLQLHDAEDSNIMVWHNNRSSSTRFCRVVNLQFAKETKELSLAQQKHMEDQITTLEPTVIITGDGKKLHVTHKLMCTMLDGKLCSALTEVSVQRCYLCNASPKEMGNIEAILQRPVNKANYRFGLSNLHLYIRFMECLIHVSYRKDVKCWATRTSLQKASVAERKATIQHEFKSKFGLLIDVPKQGSGTTNDGNTARRFFENSSETASILDLDEGLVTRLSVVLQTLASGFAVDVEAFRQYCLDTARVYMSLYGSWFFMPSSMHKVLLHGADIIEHLGVPIGMLSEEPQESRNKDVKRFRQFRTRKCSRVATNEDLVRRLLITSDPILSSMRQPSANARKPLSPAVLSLLSSPSLAQDIAHIEDSTMSDMDEDMSS